MNKQVVDDRKYWEPVNNNNYKCWERVSKKQARNLYNKGVALVVAACKVHPFGIIGGMEINNGFGCDFDKWVNSFEHYNCNYECGYYAAFWKKLE